MRTLEQYLAMPWHIRRVEHDDDGHYASLEIDELPGFVVAARTDDELDREFWPALESFLRSYLDDGEEPPVPALVRAWDLAAKSAPPPVLPGRMAAPGSAEPARSFGAEWPDTVRVAKGRLQEA